MSAPSHALRPSLLTRAARTGVVLYVVALVALPLVVLTQVGLADGVGPFVDRISAPVAKSAIWLSVWTGLLVGVVDVFLGTATAWVLVRYEFPGKSIVSAAIDLPLAIPTLVAGIMLAILYGPTSMIGRQLSILGIDIVFAPPGIVLALMFVTLPFVVRAVEPVLAEIDPAEEEAALTLGAGPARTFRTVFLPALLPAALSGGIRSVGRAAGEFGSIVVVAGNIPFQTLTAPVFVYGEIESGAPEAAAAVAVVLLAFAVTLHALSRWLELRTGARNATR